MKPIWLPITVTMGSRALGRAWRMSTRRRDWPRARAARMYISSRFSMTAALVTRMIGGTYTVTSATTGNTM